MSESERASPTRQAKKGTVQEDRWELESYLKYLSKHTNKLDTLNCQEEGTYRVLPKEKKVEAHMAQVDYILNGFTEKKGRKSVRLKGDT